MARKRYNPETIIRKLSEAEAVHGQGKTIAEAIKQLGVTEQTSRRWRKEYGGTRLAPTIHLVAARTPLSQRGIVVL